MHRAERCRPRWSWRTIIKAFPFCGETLNDYYENFSGMGPAIRPVGRCLGRVGRTELRTVPVHSYLRILQQKSSLCVEPVHSARCGASSNGLKINHGRFIHSSCVCDVRAYAYAPASRYSFSSFFRIEQIPRKRADRRQRQHRRQAAVHFNRRDAVRQRQRNRLSVFTSRASIAQTVTTQMRIMKNWMQ